MKIPIIDKFQIAGFALSVIIVLGLMLLGQDTILSVVLGLVLAVLTQLFDLQMRLASTEEKILQASILDKRLYQDEWLLQQVQEMISDYFRVKPEWLELFHRKAQDAISDCRNILHSLSEGTLATQPKSSYTLGANAIEQYATASVKIVTVSDINYLRMTYAQKLWQAYENVIKRGVKITRVFVDKPEFLSSAKDVFDRLDSIGVEVFVVDVGDLPLSLVQEIQIIDDKVFATNELATDGKVRGQKIVIDLVEVRQVVTQFQQVLRYAKRANEPLSQA